MNVTQHVILPIALPRGYKKNLLNPKKSSVRVWRPGCTNLRTNEAGPVTTPKPRIDSYAPIPSSAT